MKTINVSMLGLLAVLVAPAFVVGGQPRDESGEPSSGTTEKKHGYASVNGLKMYYEIHGTGKPLVLLHDVRTNKPEWKMNDIGSHLSTHILLT